MKTQNLLDVRTIAPKLKHSAIFQHFDKLSAGQHLTLLNDHDPLPLYYQFQAERPDQFTWNYIEKGPEVWKVAITKTGHVRTVADVLLENPRAAYIFKKYHIDFCCKGSRSLEEACAKAGIPVKEILKEIDQSTENPPFNMRANDWPLDFLVDYIVNNHHQYIQEKTPELLNLLAKVAKVHGEQHPELNEIAGIFNVVADELMSHMQKEEQVLFPAIKALVNQKNTGNGKADFPFGSIQNPIRMMEEEHTDAGDGMDTIRKLSRDYMVPDDACTSYRLLFDMLAAYENDLHQHVHLENNILFPKIIEMEAALNLK